MSQPSPLSTDRNLLFGILALQLDFIDRDALVAGMHAWTVAKTKSLGQILLEQDRLSAGQLGALESLLVEHLKAHGNDVKTSCSVLTAAEETRSALTGFDDEDVRSWLNGPTSVVCTDATLDYVPGQADGNRYNYLPPYTRGAEGSRYKHLRPHACGGLGEVFVAEDLELHREVALKEIRRDHADESDSRGRFILEAEITGGLEHPGIVPVYGLGAYPDGRPFYAMRFIRGDSLKVAIERFHADDQPGRDPRERGLALRHLLGRFVDVCNAVAYAHSRGVLHRDLKPANVMLGKFGETLVVDWGLAKAGLQGPKREVGPLDVEDRMVRPSSGSCAEKTQAGRTLGTPAFMSPEQAAGRLTELGPASDIYSLGSTFYELLTGERPFKGSEEIDVLALVRRGEFVRPDVAKSDIPAALSAICVQAMALNPADRYASALDLAADVERWLADEPVTAYPEPWHVRASRWARRHRTALVASVVFLVSAVIALSVSTGLIWAEQQRTYAQKEIAHTNYKLARDLSFASIDLMESSETDFAANPVQDAKRKEILTNAAKACQQFLKDAPPDDEFLQTRSAVVFRMAANYHRMENNPMKSAELYDESIALQRKLTAQFPDDIERRNTLASTLRDQASMFALIGRLDKAGDDLREAIQMTPADAAGSTNQRRTLATSQLDLSSIEFSRGNFRESKLLADSASKEFAELVHLPAEQRHPYDPLLRAAALNRLAAATREEGAIKEARSLHNASIKILNELKDKPPPRVVVADVLAHLARARFEQARTLANLPEKRGDAQKNLQAVALQWQLLAKNHPKVPYYRSAQRYAMVVLGEMRLEDGLVTDANSNFEAAKNVLEPLVREFPHAPGYRGYLGRAYLGLARAAAKEKQEAAGQWMAKALATLSLAAEQSPNSIETRRALETARAKN